MYITERALKRQQRLKRARKMFACGSGIVIIALVVYCLVNGFLGYFMMSFVLCLMWLNFFDDVLRGEEE